MGYCQTFIIILLINFISRKTIAGACETIPSTVRFEKVIKGPNDQIERTCEGEIAVNKCEGSCLSKVQPSQTAKFHFNKVCQCCREKENRFRKITLPKCYDQFGKPLSGEKATYVITVREPIDCGCYSCQSR